MRRCINIKKRTKRLYRVVLTFVAVFVAIVSLSGCNLNFKEETFDDGADYRQQMRSWVITISSIAKEKDSEFIVIPQNCAPLFTSTGDTSGEKAEDFLAAIDAIGIEGLSYGNDTYNKKRDESEKSDLSALLDLGKQKGVSVFIVDYCDDDYKVSDAMEFNKEKGYVSFIAEDMELTRLPDNPSDMDDEDIITLDNAKNWLILLNPERYETKTSYIDALSKTNYDVLVIDAFFGEEILTSSDTSKLKMKENGASRIVIAYLSIGEAEDYRYYWKEEYKNDPPQWMLDENPRWKGNYPVEYWNDEWQGIIAVGEDSYLNKIIGAGFDGAYLDIVDGYETFENGK